ncbi:MULTISPECIES: phosphoribosylanthranilate isomerase [Aneurinibacillus]|uniref:N-(5'-phosphoribosyl)anthranilate isomerase n=1 Tax=Aneurinibacillus thermoaerophilus TaxID=143495 RepID=A0A1G8BS48_ANETH|nr:MULTISPECIES: phosphoribosylanthranilate isomerase [Aneurinibacillus]AMA73565.1 hypothetical protein ACH33_12335 [Aneurinibacillus sp. XH2]MED0674956.1 phosphoribosylanthranilate isomerase [Aneurinibacillus thermoaerophilus]MED0679643.1 phosphoribosylanthranilate isomerase [Aneurinibacillus thermoaerophilus]MED0737359.1 phosphoribosylanthranilate isomerase [Aneurinibacillus thermoaerophilus]MED0756208.1 phosphoribosylanthranilate isomerase [Aneurinibacillus thermoaerophilus]
MRPLLKICGITEEATLALIAERNLHVDQLGFVFAESRRKVTPAEWERLAHTVPFGARSVGVFVNPSLQEIAEVFRAAPLDIIQLHGDETPEFCREVRRRFKCAVTKTFSISDGKEERRGQDGTRHVIEYAGTVDYVLLDTACGARRGGTGRTFAWERIEEYHTWAKAHNLPLLVAGGLNAGNIAALLRRYRPDGVDISSGAETQGRKDIEKIQTIIERMDEYEQSAVE